MAYPQLNRKERGPAFRALESLSVEICKASGDVRGALGSQAYRDELYNRREELGAAIEAARRELRDAGIYANPYVDGLDFALRDVTHPHA